MPEAILQSNGGTTHDPATTTMSGSTIGHPTKTPVSLDKASVPCQKSIDKQSWDYVVRSGLAGGTAGCAAKTLIAPLDRVKILFQASSPDFAKYTGRPAGVLLAMRDIKTHEGVLGLFRGHSVTLLRIFPYAAIKFVAYEQFRALLIPTKDHETGARRFAAGSFAGVTSVFFTYPLEVMRVRLAFETRRDRQTGLRSLLKRIYREGEASASAAAATGGGNRGGLSGLANFYRGFNATVLGMLPYAGVSFWTHDLVGDILRSPAMARYSVKDEEPGVGRKPVLKAWAQMTAGGLAGMFSQTASYPMEVIRRRMQVGGAIGEGKFLKIKDTAKTILRERGLRGFYVGLTIGYIKVIPMVATSFFVYERCKLYLRI